MFNPELIEKYKFQIALALIGLSLMGAGILFYQNNTDTKSDKVEVLDSTSESDKDSSEIIVEVAGAVNNPGVYKFSSNDRVENALTAAGGVTTDANTDWMDRILNRASQLSDGQKIYIPAVDEQSKDTSANNVGGVQTASSTFSADSTNAININTATQNQLESLSGIGPVTAQNIIEQRPYSTVEELLAKKVLSEKVYEKNKSLLTTY